MKKSYPKPVSNYHNSRKDVVMITHKKLTWDNLKQVIVITMKQRNNKPTCTDLL